VVLTIFTIECIAIVRYDRAVKIAGLVASVYVIAAFVALSVACAVLGFEQPALPVRYAVLAVSLVLCLAVHECGHRLAGAAQGWTCVRFGFGPFEFSREGKRWQIHRVKWIWGAFVRHLPGTFTGFRYQKAITLLGGPSASLLFALTCALLASKATTDGEFWLFGSLAVCSGLGFLELIPYRFAAGQSDGASLWQLRTIGGSDTMQREILAETSNLTPLRYRDWPRDVLDRLTKSGEDYDLYLAYLHHLDSGHIDTAAQCLSRLKLDPNDSNAAGYSCEGAWFYAIHRQEAAEARKWLERGVTCPDRGNVSRAKAAVAWVEGDVELARKLAEEALALHDPLSPSGSDAYEIDLLNSLLNRLSEAGVSALA